MVATESTARTVRVAEVVAGWAEILRTVSWLAWAAQEVAQEVAEALRARGRPREVRRLGSSRYVRI